MVAVDASGGRLGFIRLETRAANFTGEKRGYASEIAVSAILPAPGERTYRPLHPQSMSLGQVVEPDAEVLWASQGGVVPVGRRVGDEPGDVSLPRECVQGDVTWQALQMLVGLVRIEPSGKHDPPPAVRSRLRTGRPGTRRPRPES